MPAGALQTLSAISRALHSGYAKYYDWGILDPDISVGALTNEVDVIFETLHDVMIKTSERQRSSQNQQCSQVLGEPEPNPWHYHPSALHNEWWGLPGSSSGFTFH